MKLRLSKIDATIQDSGYAVMDGNKVLGYMEAGEVACLIEDINEQEAYAESCGIRTPSVF